MPQPPVRSIVVGDEQHYRNHAPNECLFCTNLGQYSRDINSSRLFVCVGETVSGENPPYADEDVIVYMTTPNGTTVRQYHRVSELDEYLSPAGLIMARDRARGMGILTDSPRQSTEPTEETVEEAQDAGGNLHEHIKDGNMSFLVKRRLVLDLVEEPGQTVTAQPHDHVWYHRSAEGRVFFYDMDGRMCNVPVTNYSYLEQDGYIKMTSKWISPKVAWEILAGLGSNRKPLPQLGDALERLEA